MVWSVLVLYSLCFHAGRAAQDRHVFIWTMCLCCGENVGILKTKSGIFIFLGMCNSNLHLKFVYLYELLHREFCNGVNEATVVFSLVHPGAMCALKCWTHTHTHTPRFMMQLDLNTES